MAGGSFAHVTLDMLYAELVSVHRDVETLKSAVIPVEKIGASERRELEAISKEMAAGKKHSFKEVFG